MRTFEAMMCWGRGMIYSAVDIFALALLLYYCIRDIGPSSEHGTTLEMLGKADCQTAVSSLRSPFFASARGDGEAQYWAPTREPNSLGCRAECRRWWWWCYIFVRNTREEERQKGE